MAFYVIGDGNNLYEGMTKEQILAAITQAVESHTISDVDTGFVTKVKEQNKNKQLQLWVGTEAEYNAIATKDQNTLYIKTDDSTLENLEQQYDEFSGDIQGLTEDIQGLTEDIEGISADIEKVSKAYIVGCWDYTATDSQTGETEKWHVDFYNNGIFDAFVRFDNVDLSFQGSSPVYSAAYQFPITFDGESIEGLGQVNYHSALYMDANIARSTAGCWTGSCHKPSAQQLEFFIYSSSNTALTDQTLNAHIVGTYTATSEE